MARPRTTVLQVVASVALVVGSYLPWLRVNPTYRYVNAVHIFGMDAGFQTLDYPLLGVSGLVLLTVLATRQRSLRAAASLCAGGVTVFLCAMYLREDTVGFGVMFVPDMGWYVSLLCGLFFLVAGGAYVIRLFGFPRRVAALDRRP
mgnify:CR=1 FL=1